MYKVSAPGSIMIMGEHAVLHAKPAIVLAIDKRVFVTLIPNNSNSKDITIQSSFGEHKCSINDIQVKAPFSYVLQAISLFKDQLTNGFSLLIESNISATVGFGSSAAVVSAVVASLLWFTNKSQPAAKEVFDIAKKVILLVQEQRGSGADLVASVFGGLNAYSVEPFSINKITNNLTLLAVYCGYKTPTPEVIKIVQSKQQLNPELYNAIYNLMEYCTLDAISSLQNNNLVMFGKMMQIYHNLLGQLGVSDNNLNNICSELLKNKNIIGAKISGSGLGDCVIGLAKSNNIDLNSFDAFDAKNKYIITTSKDGLIYE